MIISRTLKQRIPTLQDGYYLTFHFLQIFIPAPAGSVFFDISLFCLQVPENSNHAVGLYIVQFKTEFFIVLIELPVSIRF